MRVGVVAPHAVTRRRIATRRRDVMLRLKSRSVLCTPNTGLSRALHALRVDETIAGGDGDGREDVDDADAETRDGVAREGRRMDFQGMSQVSQPMGGGAGASGGSAGRGDSQEFGGPDFITPADAQFDAYAGYDGDARGEGGKDFRGARSPCALSPTRNKRPRFGLDVGLSQGTPTDFGYASQPAEGTQPSQSQGEGWIGGGGFRVPRNREPARAAGTRSGLPRAATSPQCARNAFLLDDEQPPETTAHGRRANCTSAAQLATMSRFRVDFVDLGCIARGGFSKVHRVIGRLDGCQYALKRTDKKLQTERERAEALREVHVMASLVTCPEIVRYHSAWWENDHLYIHMELCDGSASKMVDSQSGERMTEAQVMRCLRDVASALAFAHDRGMAHMDIKPDNIFISKLGFKLGDWGRAAPLNGERREALAVDEGDARYLPPELLNDDFSALDRADVFSLGASIYELAIGTSLPSNGDDYQALRQGLVPRDSCGDVAYAHIVRMMAPIARDRPSALDIISSL